MGNAAGDDRLNIRQVAALAGVSHMTVSRVLNDSPNIRPETRAKVLKVIDEVKFRPNSAARALATKRSKRIGVIVDSAVEYGPGSTLRGVEEAAREAGYTVSSVTLAHTRDESPHEAVEHLTSQGIDALCVIAPRSSSVDVLREITGGIPVLVVKADADASFLTGSVDQRRGATLATEHLISLGHREILHVAGPLDWLDARARERAWHAAVRKAGLREHPVVVGDWTSDFGYEFGRSVRSAPPFTAIFAANDQMALGLLHGLREAGLDVPGDVSVVGFDDLPDARHFLPPLTTIRQDFHALGVRTVESLRASLEGTPLKHGFKIAPELVVRASTAAPRER
ncbi:MAG: LacI family DNA-binding transcriptional regulator [Microbacteriaceae bacterium]|nr:LacI family DNA-binding transcriptional regulator [Microbacteriaceae bacterium]